MLIMNSQMFEPDYICLKQVQLGLRYPSAFNGLFNLSAVHILA